MEDEKLPPVTDLSSPSTYFGPSLGEDTCEYEKWLTKDNTMDTLQPSSTPPPGDHLAANTQQPRRSCRRSFHSLSSSSDCSSLLQSPSYYLQDEYTNMAWEEVASSMWSFTSDSRSLSRSSSRRSEPQMSVSHPLSMLAERLQTVRKELMSLFSHQRCKLVLVPAEIDVQTWLLRVENELDIIGKLPRMSAVRILPWMRRNVAPRNLERSVLELERDGGKLLDAISRKFARRSSSVDRIQTHLLLKSHHTVCIRGSSDANNTVSLALALAEALNLLVRFDTIVWVTVTGLKTTDGIRKKIGERVGLSVTDDPSGSEDSSLVLTNTLSGTRFLLILDNVGFRLDHLQEIGIPRPSTLLQSGSMVVLTSCLEQVLEDRLVTVIDVPMLDSGGNRDGTFYFGLNTSAGEGVKLYRLDEVDQVHCALHGDLHRTGSIDSGSGEDLQTYPEWVSDLLKNSHELLQLRENILAELRHWRCNVLAFPVAIDAQSWFLRVEQQLALVRELQRGSTAPPRLKESITKLGSEGGIMLDAFDRSAFVGHEDLMFRIQKILREDTYYSVVAITGESGIGKTRIVAETLAEWIYPFFPFFDALIWLTDSDGMTAAAIRERIAQRLRSLSIIGDEEEGIEILSKLRFLLVLDDLRGNWNMRDVGIPGLPVLRQRRSKIVMTCRRERVCREMGAQLLLIEVPLLSVEQSWVLLMNVVGEDKIDDEIGYNLAEELVKERVGGLPSMVINIGKKIKDATGHELKQIVDNLLRSIGRVGGGEEDGGNELAHYYGIRNPDSGDDFYRLEEMDQLHRAMSVQNRFCVLWFLNNFQHRNKASLAS